MTQATRNRPQDTTLDQLFAVLSHPTRRRILSVLARYDSDDEEEFDPEAFAPAGTDLVLFEQRAHHQHFPRLAEAGFVDWDRDANTVTHGESFEEIRPLLELLNENEDKLPDGWE